MSSYRGAIAETGNSQNPYAPCEGDCGAAEVYEMQIDANDVMKIEVPCGQGRDRTFDMSDHHPLVAGRLSGGRESYIFELSKKDINGCPGSGPTPEEVRFVQRRRDRKVIFTIPSPSERLHLWVLRYDRSAYMNCEYYADKLRSEKIGVDPTGPFSWKLHRLLPTTF